MSDVRPWYGRHLVTLHKQELELFDQIYVVLLRVLTLLIITSDQVCMHAYIVITFFCLPSIVFIKPFHCTNALLHPKQVLTRRSSRKHLVQLQSYHGFLS